MGNIEYFRKELSKSFKYHIDREVVPGALRFIKDEVNIFIDKKINELKRTDDNTIKPQHSNRKSKNLNPTK